MCKCLCHRLVVLLKGPFFFSGPTFMYLLSWLQNTCWNALRMWILESGQKRLVLHEFCVVLTLANPCFFFLLAFFLVGGGMNGGHRCPNMTFYWLGFRLTSSWTSPCVHSKHAFKPFTYKSLNFPFQKQTQFISLSLFKTCWILEVTRHCATVTPAFVCQTLCYCRVTLTDSICIYLWFHSSRAR